VTGIGGRLLVVSAHAADFVWRAGGYIAVITAVYGEVHVAKGQAWGQKTIDSFHTHGTPPVVDSPVVDSPVEVDR